MDCDIIHYKEKEEKKKKLSLNFVLFVEATCKRNGEYNFAIITGFQFQKTFVNS